jgi:hypothetical protein
LEVDFVRENGGEERGECGLDREGIDVEGNVGERRVEEVEVVVDGGGRRSREARDREVEERDGFVTLG